MVMGSGDGGGSQEGYRAGSRRGLRGIWGRREAAPEKCGQKGSALVMPWVVCCTHVCLMAMRILPSIASHA